MPRPERPVDPGAGPVAEFALELRALRRESGLTYREMSRRAHYSWVTLADAAKGNRLPSLPVVEAFVTACRSVAQVPEAPGATGDAPRTARPLDEWRRMWEAAAEAAATARPEPEPDGPGGYGHSSAILARLPAGPGDPDAPDAAVAPGPAPLVVVDDHELVSRALVATLRAEGTAAQEWSPATVPDRLAAGGPPGVVILDLELGRGPDGGRIDGVEFVEEFVRRGWYVLVLSGTSDAARVGAALARGAHDWISKNAPWAVLSVSIDGARAGTPSLPASRRAELIRLWEDAEERRSETRSRLDLLSVREREILDLLAAGNRAARIAEITGVSLSTVRSHTQNVLAKLGVSSQLEAVVLVRRAGPG